MFGPPHLGFAEQLPIVRIKFGAFWDRNLTPEEANWPTLYIFLDEGGNFDFSKRGSRYFTLTCVSMLRPFALHTELDTYKYDLIEFRKLPRIDIEHFHAAEDNRYVRGRVMEMLAQRLPKSSVDAVVVEKPKTGPALREPAKFYPKMLGYLLRFAMKQFPTVIGEIVIITDTIPVNRKRQAVEKALKLTLAEMLPKGVPYRVMHHASKAHFGLQVVDYLNWAIYRKWEHGDAEHYDRIAHLVRSEFDIFRTGQRRYYEM